MSTDSTKEFFQRYISALTNEGKAPEVMQRYISDEALLEHIAMFEAAFPGYTLEPQDIIAEDDKLVLRAMFRGVHRGAFQGMPPTGREVSTPVVVIYRVAGGKIAEHWLSANLLDLMQQLQGAPALA
jgi:predicted ester cyclase